MAIRLERRLIDQRRRMREKAWPRRDTDREGR
jgi:hypothetical protein